MLCVNPRLSRTITCVERKDDTLYLWSAWGNIRLKPQTASIVRISCTEQGKEFSDRTGRGIVFNESFADWEFSETPEGITVVLPQMTIEISRESGSMRYFDRAHRLLLAEAETESRMLEAFDSYQTVIDANTKIRKEETADGVKETVAEAAAVFDKKLYHTRLSLQFQDGEALYGLGQAEEGLLNLRGSTQYLHQANLKIAIPFLLSTKGWGLLSATDGTAIFSDTQYGSYFYTEADEQMDYYFVQGENPDALIRGYRTLTGKAVMLPLWAFGYMQSQERYETQEEILRIAGEYRKRKLGLDTIVLDWCSWPGSLWGQKSFDPERFPDPAAMTEQLHENHVRFMISIWPRMDEKAPDYQAFRDRNLLLPGNTIYHAFKKEARDLYWHQAKTGLFDCGVDAWWCDSSEPFQPEWGKSMKPEPAALYQEYRSTASKHLPQETINAYGLFHAQTIYDGQRKTGSPKRVVNLTRSTYVGGQRYGVILWSGDTYASWETLKKQIPAGLNFCASGLPYWTLDIGAFFVKKGTPWFWNGAYDDGLDDLGYRELYTRWFQYGAFLPVFRSHGTDVRREMWAFGDEGDLFYEALKAANQLRYRLMPYIYSWAGKVWKDDSTMMRMLAFDFSEDPNVYNLTDEYMFGDSLLVCPITEPMYYGVHSEALDVKEKGRKVYLPAGCDWYDFYTDRKYEGGQEIFAEADISHIPLFVRAGTILPMVRPLESTDELADAPVSYHVYPGKADAALQMYEDAGDGYGYENGEYQVRNLIFRQADGTLWDEDTHTALTPVMHGSL